MNNQESFTMQPIHTIDKECQDRHKLCIENLSVAYREKPAVKISSLSVCRGCITAIIGPSGCGKTSFLMAVNRLIDLIPGARAQGTVLLDGVNILNPKIKIQNVRRRIGMIFQKPNPFPLSIFDNVAFALREHGVRETQKLNEQVRYALQAVGLWDEVKDKLHQSGLTLSGGQQQRLCIARAIALKPEVLLMDEPCSALDPKSSVRIEELIRDLARNYTILIVTHNLQQAKRLSDFTAFFYSENGWGELMEYGPTQKLFESPNHPQTQDYVMGRFG